MIILGLISDLLLLGATIGMALYCRLLSNRLKAFNNLDSGIGGTVATLALQVDDLQASLKAVQEDVDGRADQLRKVVADADDRIGQLEMLMAGLEDIEDATDPPEVAIPEPVVAVPSFRASRAQATERVVG